MNIIVTIIKKLGAKPLAAVGLMIPQMIIQLYVWFVFWGAGLGFIGTFWWDAEVSDMGDQWAIVEPIAAAYNVGIYFGQIATDVGYVYDCDCTDSLEEYGV